MLFSVIFLDLYDLKDRLANSGIIILAVNCKNFAYLYSILSKSKSVIIDHKDLIL